MITQEQKTNLAKLLATENISVEHRKVETAYFIPKTRVLCLPIWEDMSNDLYDLLVGHEVGHALYTPQDDNEFKKYKIPHSYLNVIEDIRIDKKMKLKYPGLRRSYFHGYNELIENDFFKTKEIDVNKLRFIDRLNMFSKSGQREQIDFSEEEQDFIRKSDNLNTWKDVIDLAKEIYAYSQDEQFDEEEQEALASPNGNVQFDEDGDEELVEQEGDSNEQQEQDQETSSSSGSNTDKSEEEEKQSSGSSNDKEDKKEEEIKSQSSPSGQEAGYDPTANEAATDKNFSETSKSLAKTDKEIQDNYYVTLPKRLDAVVSVKEVTEIINTFRHNETEYPMKTRLDDFKKFKRDSLRTVNYMVKEFEMKKAAAAYTRTRTARTGMINTNALHSYKYNDDIFKRINIEPGAKNHGMVMVIDWSGSMHDKIYNTIVQTMNLVMFCKAVNIPFEVYAFSDVSKQYFKKKEEYVPYFSQGNGRYQNLPVVLDKADQLVMENCSMIQFVTSDLKTVQYNEAMANLFAVAKSFDGSRRMRRYDDPVAPYLDLPSCMRLGGTPLDSAILNSIDIVNKFQTKHRIQKMNTVFLTDGCGHTSSQVTMYDKDNKLTTNGIYSALIKIKDGSYTIDYGSKEHRGTFHSHHKQMLKYFKHKTNSSCIGYYITGRTLKYWDIAIFDKGAYEAYEDAKKQMRKDKCVTLQNIGYDELFIITQNNLKVEDEEVNITTDMTTAKMKQQFLKNFKSKKLSRVLLNKFVERVA